MLIRRLRREPSRFYAAGPRVAADNGREAFVVGSVTLTTDSCKTGATTLSRTTFSGYVARDYI